MTRHFSSFLASADQMKQAGVELPNQQQTEQEFSTLAYQFVADRAGILSPFMLGFEIVERDEDGSKLCGVFGYKIAGSYYLLPVFFINGQIKGVNSIYSRDSNAFMPITEDYLLKLLNKQSQELGQSVDRSSVFRSIDTPNMGLFKHPFSKLASAGEMEEAVKAMFKVAEATFSDPQAMQDMAYALVDKEARETFDPSTSSLHQFIKQAGPFTNVGYLMLCASNSKFASAATDLYGDALSLRVDPKDHPDTAAEFRSVKKAEEKDNDTDNGKVTLITRSSPGGCCTPNCCSSDEEASKLIRTGFLIRDTRPEKNKSEVFSAGYESSMTAPYKGGKYNLLLSCGLFCKSLVLKPMNKNFSTNYLCIHEDSGSMFQAPGNSLFINQEEIGAFGNPFDDAKEITAIEVDASYDSRKTVILLDEEGNYFGPFTVSSKAENPDGTILLSVSKSYVPEFNERYDRSGRCSHAYYSTLRLDPSRAGKIVELSDSSSVSIPCKGVKALFFSPNRESNDSLVFKPGTAATLSYHMLENGFQKVRLVKSTDDDLFSVQSSSYTTGYMSKKQACLDLMLRLGFSLQDTEELVKEAEEGLEARRLVKLAQAYNPPDVMMPYYQFPEWNGADNFSGSLISTPMETELQGMTARHLAIPNPMDKSKLDRDFSRGIDTAAPNETPTPDNEAFQLAAQAAQSGQRTVFDHAGIAGLAKTYDVGTILDSFIPEMKKSVDRLGRILFLFQWKNEDFAERFGLDSLPEVEDSLNAIYKGYGDLVLKLSEKAIASTKGEEAYA